MSASDMPLLELKNVGVNHGSRTVLNDISLTVDLGKIITIIGPNGGGKSTLVKVIAGLISPGKGQRVHGKNVRIGYVPQKLAVDKSIPLTVSRFLSIGAPKDFNDQNVLMSVSGQNLGQRQLHDLSGGELQRVLIARAISRKPNLLLLDEPMQGVDVTGQSALYRLVGNIRDKLDCAVVMVSHDLHLVMAETDRVICLNHHICCEGKPESVTQHPEYLSLFGEHAAANVAVYTHHHDHQHKLDGGIEPCEVGDEHND